MTDETTKTADDLKASLKDGETFVKGVISRVVTMGDGSDPLVFFRPITETRHLELEGHRVATGELVVTHDKGGVPKQFDLKRVALEGDLAVGTTIGLVHLDRVRR